MICALCDQFLWQEAGAVGGRRVCRSCLKSLAEQAGLAFASDADVSDAMFADIYETLKSAADDAIEDAIREAKRRNGRVKVA